MAGRDASPGLCTPRLLGPPHPHGLPHPGVGLEEHCRDCVETEGDGAEIPKAHLPLHTVSRETPQPGCGGALVLTLGGAWGGTGSGPDPPPCRASPCVTPRQLGCSPGLSFPLPWDTVVWSSESESSASGDLGRFWSLTLTVL